MDLYRPRDTSGLKPILYFHAMAHLGIEGLVIVEPSDRFVSVGFFDDTAKIVDLDRCHALGLPVMRREVGGGAVLLGPGQVFYHLVMQRGSHGIPVQVDEAYKVLSIPPIETYAHFGVEARYRPINDLITPEGRKISGQGAADIGKCFVFVGSILRHFDVATMTQVLRVPDEKFRDKIFKTMDENMSWLERESQARPTSREVGDVLAASFGRLLGPLHEKVLPPEAITLAEQLGGEFTSDEFLFEETPRRHEAIKIREGVYLRQGMHKARGGLIWAEVEVAEDRIAALKIGGDFTFIPKGDFAPLQDHLIGAPFEVETVASSIARFMAERAVETPGVLPCDFAQAIVGQG
ncbi:MAG: biotin--protein ligase [Alphaproteobacteria bacterium CG_4_10_14_0_2_um_filter_63_37]|nr:MAG: hypothetical protein AUJ55_00530 [Proteobacteria bacterium CG1_02_64_396]PJA23994.1 MAG: biotin--protein ligase [Alphaproteobacteria bacterium CG_4_10_14_0_2_um_filter_63_37]